uniref:CCHC-type domain-containing protein n=1 Tax=Leersia perrieri TaxID=77586 RepID=A0A0D9WXE5_9ORYZ
MKLQPIAEASTSTTGTSRKVRKRRRGKKGKNPTKPYGHQDQWCYRCGNWEHWSRICRELLHATDVQQSKKKRKRKPRTRRAGKKGPVNANTPIKIPNITPQEASEEDVWVIVEISSNDLPVCI